MAVQLVLVCALCCAAGYGFYAFNFIGKVTKHKTEDKNRAPLCLCPFLRGQQVAATMCHLFSNS